MGTLLIPVALPAEAKTKRSGGTLALSDEIGDAAEMRGISRHEIKAMHESRGGDQDVGVRMRALRLWSNP